MLGFGRAAREVCAIALRRRVCFRHLASAKYECDLEALSFSESKSASGSSYVCTVDRIAVVNYTLHDIEHGHDEHTSDTSCKNVHECILELAAPADQSRTVGGIYSV